MNLSKQRLLHIIREEIASLTEGEQEEPITPLERRWLRRTADPGYHSARTARRAKRAREKVDVQHPRKRKVSPEQEELNARLAGLREEDSNALERMVREEMEEYLSEEDNSFSKAGEEIEKKGTEGVFTAKAKKAGMGVQAYADKVLAKDSKASTKTKRQAAFAKGAATVARENK